MFEAFASILTIIVFLIPGYIWITVESQFVFLDKRLEWEKYALGLLARSTVVYVLWGAMLYKAWKESWLDTLPLSSTILATAVLFCTPVSLGFCWGILRQKNIVRRILTKVKLKTFEQHHIPTAWDHVFSDLAPEWAIVTLEDGAKVYGFLGPASYFSSDGDDRDMFISDVLHRKKDGTMEKVPNTAGVYIAKNKIALIEFIKV